MNERQQNCINMIGKVVQTALNIAYDKNDGAIALATTIGVVAHNVGSGEGTEEERIDAASALAAALVTCTRIVIANPTDNVAAFVNGVLANWSGCEGCEEKATGLCKETVQ
jgi:hypothetical protein